MSQLGDTFQGIIKISNGNVRILDAQAIGGALLDRLTWTATFHEKVEMRGTSRWLIKMFAAPFGIDLSGNETSGESPQASIPKIKINGMCYDMSRRLFRAALQTQLMTFVFISTSEKKQAGDMAVVTAAAMQEGFQGCLIFQVPDRLEKETENIVFTTDLQRVQGDRSPEVLSAENPETHALQIRTTVFSKEEIEATEQEVFLSQLAASQSDFITLEVTKKLEAYFKKSHRPDPLAMIQKKGPVEAVSFALRDEITAAIAEADPRQEQAFSKSFSGLKTRT